MWSTRLTEESIRSDNMKLQIEAILEGFATKSDHGLSLRFSTNEVSGEDILMLSKLKKTFGWLMFKENEFTLEDMPKEQAEDRSKTPSKRIRSVLFLIWQQEGSHGSFEAYYAEKMEKIINHLKGKLD